MQTKENNSNGQFETQKEKLNLQKQEKEKVVEVDEEVDYEALPPNFSFTAHMMAGAMAGIAEHGLLFPLDSIKTRMQIVSTSASAANASRIPIIASISHTFKSVASAEGVRGLWRGFGSMIMGAGPSHAIYFAVYEDFKRYLSQNHSIVHPLFASALSGATATCFAEAFMNPFDVIKQRMQIGYAALDICKIAQPSASCAITSASCPPQDLLPRNVLRYSSIWHCFRHTLKTEGVSAFYVSYPTTLAMAVPFQSINFTVYELMRSILHPFVTCSPILNQSIFQSSPISTFTTTKIPTNEYNPHSYSPLTHALSGGIAGGIAALVTTPMDVVKTLLQTRGISTCPHVRSASSISDACKIIYSREGLRGFMRGSRARVIGAMPAAGISWLTYEYFKWILQGKAYFLAKEELERKKVRESSDDSSSKTDAKYKIVDVVR